MVMDKEILTSWLIREYKYPPTGAVMVAEELLNCAPDLCAAFDDWLNSCELPTIEVEGYSVNKLMTEHSMTPVAAFLTLDYLRREPDRAKSSLRKGHDHVQEI